MLACLDTGLSETCSDPIFVNSLMLVKVMGKTSSWQDLESCEFIPFGILFLKLHSACHAVVFLGSAILFSLVSSLPVTLHSSWESNWLGVSLKFNTSLLYFTTDFLFFLFF